MFSKLLIELNSESESLINLGLLKSNERNSDKHQQLVPLDDPTRPADKQIISREHSQLLIRQTAPACFMVLIKDTKDHDRRRTVITSKLGENFVWQGMQLLTASRTAMSFTSRR